MSEKSAYEQKAKAEMEGIAARIEQIKAKALKADADARIRAEEQIEKWKQQKKEIQAKLDELKKTGGGALEQLKSGTQQAIADLKQAVERAASQFRK